MTDVLGIKIPSTSPVFLGIVGVHVFFGLVCVIAGVVAMLSQKQEGHHPNFGTIYFWGLAVIFASSTALSIMRLQEDYHLFVLGAVAFTFALLGRTAMRRRWRGRIRLHITGMGTSYIAMLTAFYVDNGKNLPLWRDLPTIAYWTVPMTVGFPIMLWALMRHPLVRSLSNGARSASEKRQLVRSR